MKNKIIIFSILLIICIIVYSINNEYRYESNIESNKMIAYVNGKRTGDIPSKSDGYIVDKIECDNDATGTWDYESWGILITDLSDSDTKCSVYFVTGTLAYKDNSGASIPELYDGLIPVKYNSSGDTIVADISEEWYDYDNHQWANAVLVTSSARDKEPGETLSQSEILQYYVWIPRYKYKLWNTNNESSNEQMIEIEFENKNESKSNGSTNGTWLTHPAFTFGNTELNGIWVGKFEMTGSVSTSSNPTNLTIKPNESSLRNMNVSSQFNSLRNMDITYASNYGLKSSEIDAHMMKNIEWASVAYFTSTKYGRYINSSTCVSSGCEVWSNTYVSYKTGCAGNSVDIAYDTSSSNCNEWTTNNGKHASTTDNQYGIYDMSGGANDNLMGNVSSSNTIYSFNSLSSGFNSVPLDKYMDKYINSSGYDYFVGNLGDATKEIYKTNTNWYSDRYHSPSSSYYWITRGGPIDNGSYNGIYYYWFTDGGAGAKRAYRAVLTEQDGSYNGNGLN